MPVLAVLTLALMILLPGGQAVSEPRHGISVFGKLKYGPDFQHFDWADPTAPKGGLLRIRDLGTFDTVNLYILKGRRPSAVQVHEIRLHERLMVRSYDEPDAHYALVAKTVDVAEDGRTATFQLDPRARFHDGSPIRADDVVWSLNAIRDEGHPVLRSVFARATAEALAPDRVRFSFAKGAPRDLAVRVAGDLPILSATYYESHDFTETTLDPPLGSGPYRISKVRSGSSVEMERVTDYWAADLPVNRGLWNFDTIRVDYYQDRTSALLSFFADEYDFREEFTSKSWATEYDDKKPVQDGRIERLTLSDGRPSGAQGWFVNARRARFADARVRRALDLAFDFEWTNRNIFYGLYKRTGSVFENSELAQDGPPSAAELALLEPLRGQVPDGVFADAYQSASTEARGGIRGQLRQAGRLLKQAGWEIRDGVLVDANGEPFALEFLMYQPSFERVIGPYVKNLERLGIRATMRFVDAAQYVERVKAFDFDLVTARFSPPETPGAELYSFWGSAQADVAGSNNYAGVKDPAVDALIENVLSAPDRPALLAATRALDRVIMWNNYIIPQWYKGEHNLAYWDRFGRPAAPKPDYHRGVVNSWWFDSDKARRTGGRNGG
ncbi:MAG: ABC transporter substrate-binding protein [Minwuia thermotolerans]|nr:MAG: ABC transporter substrate-binding protein [Minwuia thermotolerans]